MFLNRTDELSLAFKGAGRAVKVLLIGACDGTRDGLIDRLLNQSHWKGTLVEPEMANYEELRLYTSSASDRLTLLNVAVNDVCPTPATTNLTFLRVKPDRAHRYPHWFSKEIGSVDDNITRGITTFFSTLNETSFRGTEAFTARRQDFDLVNQKVDCMTPDQFLLPNSTLTFSRRHESFDVVKIDAEGRDVAILVNLLESIRSLHVPLPILILIESKFASQESQTTLLRASDHLGYKSTLRYFKNPSQEWISRNDALFFLQSFPY